MCLWDEQEMVERGKQSEINGRRKEIVMRMCACEIKKKKEAEQK